MRHTIDLERWDDAGVRTVGAMAAAIESCVHCGFCLPACPTYRELGEEMDSPRGRIVLMKEALEGSIPIGAAAPYVDRCLGCLACEPACPSGVQYHRLLHPFRDLARAGGAGDSVLDRARRRVVHSVLPSPGRFRLALRAARLGGWLAPLLPASWRALLDWAGEAPRPLPRAASLPLQVAAEGARRARVALLTGCAQQVLAPGITAAAVRVLARNGVEVVIPPAQGCCGSLAMHDGLLETARELARRNLDAFPRDVDAIVTTAAGCGSGIAEYPDLFADAGAAEAASAAAHASLQVDVHVFLDRLGMTPPPPLARELVVAYQDACHLRQARGIAAEPRRVLESIGGLRLVEIAEPAMCCGSAGTYNLEQPAIAASLGERKAKAVLATGAEVVATGNIGCAVQLRRYLRLAGSALPVLHSVEILDRAYGGVEGRAG
jgi:glycolate oxidase iron-sulfur subunit